MVPRAPTFLWTFAAFGAAFAVKWISEEAKRVNKELRDIEAENISESSGSNDIDPIEMVVDPSTGTYRQE